ncbi:MAG TPA: dTDP-4-amino-4,6-dideoxygalactose transaminase [Polyangia bacterium]|nr:dTDP-4-amino-4,6-dideoxygalactose transaminase [Polyangia bacterium]
MRIPFNSPHEAGNERRYVAEAFAGRHLSGDGPFTKRCHAWLRAHHGAPTLLTHSCTAALELCALLADLGPGDEVILPSFTFVSTANAFVLRGATPVFVDVEPQGLNLDASLIEAAVTPRTRAICVVHYAGVGAAMDDILAIAARHGLLVFEDAAQGLMASYRGRALGTFGALGAISFHETKNIGCGEGGALVLNDERLLARAEVLREKGTNRNAFFRGEVDKYTWVDVGSSFLPSDITAAVLLAQLEHAAEITARRRDRWARYHQAFTDAESRELLLRPVELPERTHNAHMYYLLARSLAHRTKILEATRARGIGCMFHYVPLHSSPAGRRLGRVGSAMAVTDSISERLFRLPLWPDLTDAMLEEIVEVVISEAERA